jgi:hypothetical protein
MKHPLIIIVSPCSSQLRRSLALRRQGIQPAGKFDQILFCVNYYVVTGLLIFEWLKWQVKYNSIRAHAKKTEILQLLQYPRD